MQAPVYSHQWLMILAHQVPVSYSKQLQLFLIAAQKLLMSAHFVQTKVLKIKQKFPKRKKIVYLRKNL